MSAGRRAVTLFHLLNLSALHRQFVAQLLAHAFALLACRTLLVELEHYAPLGGGRAVLRLRDLLAGMVELGRELGARLGGLPVSLFHLPAHFLQTRVGRHVRRVFRLQELLRLAQRLTGCLQLRLHRGDFTTRIVQCGLRLLAQDLGVACRDKSLQFERRLVR